MSSTTSIVIAIIAFVGTIANVGVTAWFAYYSDERKRRFDERKRRSEADMLLAKYRDPLLLAADDLRHRIENLVERSAWSYLAEIDRDYLYSHTCFLIGQYFAWVYILRREVQFTCFETGSENKVLADQLRKIEDVWGSDKYINCIWELWRGYQIGIGEILAVEGKSGQLSCMGYAAFKSNLQNFEDWPSASVKGTNTAATCGGIS